MNMLKSSLRRLLRLGCKAPLSHSVRFKDHVLWKKALEMLDVGSSDMLLLHSDTPRECADILTLCEDRNQEINAAKLRELAGLALRRFSSGTRVTYRARRGERRKAVVLGIAGYYGVTVQDTCSGDVLSKKLWELEASK